ncbi:MAG TPA: alpha/beta hydrolase [Gammaproteobacteria bacterium]|nr:alpha/beta hydrolase [Gammaproteobacteria bacterium]
MRRLAFAAPLLLLAGCAHFNVTEKVWMYPGYAAMAPKAQKELAEGTGYTAQSVFFPAADGTKLHGILLTRPGNRVTVLFFGGDNFQTGTDGLEAGQLFEKLGVDGLMVDYRGYGESEGTPSLDSLRADALTAYDWLHTQPAVASTSLVVHGFSLGSMLAPYVANERPVDGLVLESTATDVPDWANSIVPWYAWPFVSIHIDPPLLKVNNVTALREYHGPLFLVVGDRDDTTPPKFSQELYADSATPAAEKRLYLVKGKDHGNALEDAGAQQQYRQFLDELVLRRK